MKSVILEFFAFLKYRKRYWLIPVFIVLLLLGLIIVLGQGSILSPFIYTFV